MGFRKGQKVRVLKKHMPHGISAGAIGKVVEPEAWGFEGLDGVTVLVPCMRKIVFQASEIKAVGRKRRKK